MACAFLGVMTTVVIGMFPGNVDLNNVDNIITAKNDENISHILADIESWTLSKLQRHYLAETSTYEHPQPLRRQLVGKCTLQDTCREKFFSECDFRGCEDLTELNLGKHAIKGPLPEGLRNLTKLYKLCVRLGGTICRTNINRFAGRLNAIDAISGIYLEK